MKPDMNNYGHGGLRKEREAFEHGLRATVGSFLDTDL